MKFRLAPFFVFALLSAVTSNAQLPYTRTFSMDDVKPNSAGWSYWLIPSGGIADTLSVKITCVMKGDALHGAHRHNHHELYIIMEGEAVVNLNGVDKVLYPGDGFFCPGGSSHSIRRTGLDSPNKYMMVNTTVPGGLKTALPFWKDRYSVEDCFVPAGKGSFWYLKPEQTLNGLNVQSILMKGKKIHKDAADGRQLTYVIMDGTADVTVDGKKVRLRNLSVCHVPAGSSGTIAAVGGPMRYLAIRTR